MTRHSIDSDVLKFTIDKLNSELDKSNSYSYIYTDSNIRIEISKIEVMRISEKISINFFNIINKEENPFNAKLQHSVRHELSFENSNKLRDFLNDKEDENNEDYIRNNSEKVLEFIKKYE